jgi:hypothetical protein
VERAALVATVRQDIATGPAAAVVGEDRPGHVERLRGLLASAPWRAAREHGARAQDPVEARRARWAIGEATRPEQPAGRFAVRVVVPDPKPEGFPRVEARILIDDVPIVAAAFDKGPADGPEQFRCDAAQYDAEIARAEQDHSWGWPARTVARLVNGQLHAEPDILGRWDCKLGWCTSRLRDPGTARLTFLHPAQQESFEDPCAQFGLVIDVADSPQACAAQLIESLRTTEPKTIAEIVGGSADAAAQLGLTPREPGRW